VTLSIAALLAHAREVPSSARHDLARHLEAHLDPGLVLLETCHRVELFGDRERVAALATHPEAGGARLVEGETVARHVLALAVGRSSAVLGEDQVLHQLRVAVHEARARGPLPPSLDHLFDLALRTGRRARSWLPGRRPSLADVALDKALAGSRHDGAVLVVGAGQMGGLVARAARHRERGVLVTSRSAERAARLAAAVGGAAIAFDPGSGDIERIAAVVVALSGPWNVGPSTARALLASDVALVDLSSPPAVDAALSTSLGERFTSVDDLARDGAAAASPALSARLDRLVDAALADYHAWLGRGPERAAARELADRASAARTAELDALWRRIPGLDPDERAEIERMAERLATRLLRDPLERLRGDADGRQRRAARELFGL
jgi:glutamyl-tRNA reductase